jgi:hypothetical protein
MIGDRTGSEFPKALENLTFDSSQGAKVKKGDSSNIVDEVQDDLGGAVKKSDSKDEFSDELGDAASSLENEPAHDDTPQNDPEIDLNSLE